MNRRKLVVAIDGPAGSGKTTISRQVAQRLGYVVIDTGALYRTLALSTLSEGLQPSNEPAFSQHCQQLVSEGSIRLGIDSEGRSQVWLRDRDVSEAIRMPAISERASVVSAVPAVREALLQLQRTLGEQGGVVVEGRDIGSVVFPKAEAKFFLTASAERRAERRFEQLQGTASSPDVQTVLRDVLERDRRDSDRDIAPMIQCDDAVLIDSTDRSLAEVVDQIVDRVELLATQCAPDNPSSTAPDKAT